MGAASLAQVILAFAVAIAAWLVSRRDASHRWLAIYLAGLAVMNVVLRIQKAALPWLAETSYDLGLVWFHAGELAHLSVPFLFLACVGHYFRVPSMIPASIGGWLTLWAFCLNYDIVNFPVLEWLYQCAGLVVLAGTWGCIFFALRRTDGPGPPRLAHLVLILYAVGDFVQNLVPLADGYVSHWPIVQWSAAFVIFSILIAHLVHLRKLRRAA